MHHYWFCLRDDLPPGLGVFKHNFVRVFLIRQCGHADIGVQMLFHSQEPAGIKPDLRFLIHGFARRFKPLEGCILTSSVGVKGQDNVSRQTLDEAELIFGQGGAHGRNRIAEARLVQSDHIHVAFHDDRLVQ